MRNTMLTVGATVAAVILVAVVGAQPHQSRTAQTKITFKVIQMFRSVTVSPSSAACAHYGRGGTGNRSSSAALGFPWAKCSVGKTTGKRNLPLTITYDGPPGQLNVKASDAIPDGSGRTWHLCGPGTRPACKGVGGQPGTDQFTLANFSAVSPAPARLTGQYECDVKFNPAGSCAAARGMSQHEGAEITGPSWSGNPAGSYTVTITWIAEPPKP